MEDNEMDGYMEFSYQFSRKDPAVFMRLAPDSDLSQVFEAFERFLRGAGYHFNGQIDIVSDDLIVNNDAELN